MRSNATARQRRSMISEMDARIAIYDRSTEQQFFPSRSYAEDVFYSIEFNQPPDWSINPEIALRGSEPGYRSGRSTMPIVKRITWWQGCRKLEAGSNWFKSELDMNHII